MRLARWSPRPFPNFHYDRDATGRLVAAWAMVGETPDGGFPAGQSRVEQPPARPGSLGKPWFFSAEATLMVAGGSDNRPGRACRDRPPSNATRAARLGAALEVVKRGRGYLGGGYHLRHQDPQHQRRSSSSSPAWSSSSSSSSSPWSSSSSSSSPRSSSSSSPGTRVTSTVSMASH